MARRGDLGVHALPSSQANHERTKIKATANVHRGARRSQVGISVDTPKAEACIRREPKSNQSLRPFAPQRGVENFRRNVSAARGRASLALDAGNGLPDCAVPSLARRPGSIESGTVLRLGVRPAAAPAAPQEARTGHQNQPCGLCE